MGCITLLVKNISVQNKSVKIKIINTFGYTEFGTEFKRVFNMAHGVLPIVVVYLTSEFAASLQGCTE
jgi:predicted membrane GTPase involved in stress response